MIRRPPTGAGSGMETVMSVCRFLPTCTLGMFTCGPVGIELVSVKAAGGNPAVVAVT